MCVCALKAILKHSTHSHIKVIIRYYAQQRSRLLCNMMCTPVRCQVSFSDVFDDVAQSEAAIFIVPETALMMSDPFSQRHLEVHWVVEKTKRYKRLSFTFTCGDLWRAKAVCAEELFDWRYIFVKIIRFFSNCLLSVLSHLYEFADKNVRIN